MSRPKKLSAETRQKRERVTDREVERGIQAAIALRAVFEALRPLAPQKRARVVRACCALHGVVLP